VTTICNSNPGQPIVKSLTVATMSPERPLPYSTDDFSCQYDTNNQRQCSFAEILGSKPCGKCQNDEFQHHHLQHAPSGHACQIVVEQGRDHRCQEGDFPSQLIRSSQDDQREGRKDDAALRNEVSHQRQHEIANYEQRGPQIGPHFVVIQAIEFCVCFHIVSF
jgi:hypothetical protein